MSTYRQVRRQTRYARRSGLQPMMVINTDQFPAPLGLILARWAWRYRSELAPLLFAIAIAVTGWVLHFTNPAAWPYLAAGAALGTSAVIVAGRRAGLVTRAERLYAAITTTAAGSWLAAATAFGAARSPLPQLLTIGVLVLAVPWWAHGRRRAKVRVERTLAAWPDIAHAVGLPGSRVLSAVVDLWGWRARLALARGQTINDAIAKIPQIESGLGTFRGAVRITPTDDDLAHRLELRVLTKDPHADAIPWPGPSVSSITQPIDLGPFEDATPCRALLLRLHALLAGSTGSGKSGGVNVVTGNLVACADVVIWAIDLKRGMELQPWASCLDRLAVTAAQARMLLADAIAVLEARADYLTGHGQRVWEPSPDLPALVIIIDEYAELPGEVAEYTDSIARRGRAPAVTVIAATQRPTQKAMGQGSVRSQMDARICFRVRERRDVDLILGQGMLAAGWDASKLNAPGKFLISAPEHHTPRRARAYLITDDDVTRTAARYAADRPPLDDVSLSALRKPSTPPRPRAGNTPDTYGLSARPAGWHIPSHAQSDPGEPEDTLDISDAVTPSSMLWAALRADPEQGTDVAELMRASGMTRPTLYRYLSQFQQDGRAEQVGWGRWRAITNDGGHVE